VIGATGDADRLHALGERQRGVDEARIRRADRDRRRVERHTRAALEEEIGARGRERLADRGLSGHARLGSCA
jgi:hypothetical protein